MIANVGGRLFPAADTVKIPSGKSSADIWVVETSGYLEGSVISFRDKSPNYVLSSRWRHGFNGNTRKFEFFAEDSGYTATEPGRNGTRTISPVEAPFYCWDVAHDRDNLPSGREDPTTSPNIELWLCDDETAYQDWIWISTLNGGFLQNVGFPNFCVGIKANEVYHGVSLVLRECSQAASSGESGALLFDTSWLEDAEVEPTHVSCLNVILPFTLDSGHLLL